MRGGNGIFGCYAAEGHMFFSNPMGACGTVQSRSLREIENSPPLRALALVTSSGLLTTNGLVTNEEEFICVRELDKLCGDGFVQEGKFATMGTRWTTMRATTLPEE